MRDEATETADFGGPPSPPSAPSRPKRRRQVVAVVVAVVLVLGGGGVIGIHLGWFGAAPAAPAAVNEIAHPLPSTPRAFTAAVLAHVPADVAVLWSNGSRSLPDDNPADDTADEMLHHQLICAVLMRQGTREVSLIITAGPPGPVPPSWGEGIAKAKRDHDGNVLSVVAFGATGAFALERVQTPSTTPLPLTTEDLKALLNDPRVGIQTDAATLARSKSIASYVDPAPAISWGGDS